MFGELREGLNVTEGEAQGRSGTYHWGREKQKARSKAEMVVPRDLSGFV